MRFANHWGSKIRACRPYRAQAKGKVERPISYVRLGFFYGRDFVSDDDLNAQASTWLQATANQRRHRSIGKKQMDRRTVLGWPPRPPRSGGVSGELG